MILTQQEKDMLDNPAGYMASENEKKPASNNLSNDELFKQMDKDLQGLGYNVGEQNEKTIKDVLIEEDIDKGNQYASMPPIDLYEGAKREVRESNGIFEFNGTYDKVIARPNELAENYKIKSEQQEQERLERNKRVNEGTASFWDRVIAYSDRVAESQKKYYQGQFNELNPNYNQNHRYFRTTSTGIPIYNEVDLTKKIGFLDEFVEGGIEGTGVGSVLNGTRTKQIRDIKQKMIEGQPIYQDELDTLNLYYESEKEKQIRGYTKFAQLGRGVGKSLGFSADFILGGGFLKALGVGNLAGNIGLKTYLGAKELGLASGIAKGAKGIAELGVNGILGSAVMTAVNAPLRLFPEYQERMLGNEAKLTDNGNMIFQESDEKPATAIMKSLGGLYISYLTELAGGEALRGVAGGISNVLAKPVGNVAGGAVGRILTSNPALKNFLATSTKELSKRYEQLRGLPVIGKSTGWLKDMVHFDGFLEEMGEEALEDVLRLTFKIDNEERNFDNYIKAIFKTPEEWAIIAGTIALQGAGLSAVSYGVARNMANAGASEEEIVDVLKNSSEAQKKQILDEQINSGMVEIPKEINQNEINKNIIKANYENLSEDELNIELKKDEIEEKTYNKLLKGRVTEEQAVANAKLVGQFFKKYGAKNAQTMKAFEEWLDKLDVQYNVPVEQQIAQFQSANTAGVNNNSEIENAKREWEEKGVESKYFKQFSENAPVVLSKDTDNYNYKTGEKVVVNVFHGTQTQKLRNDEFKNKNSEYFFTNKTESAEQYGDNIYECYVKFNNPLVVDFNGEYDSQIYDYIEEAKANGYDGVIALNTNDSASIHNQYVVFDNKKIKSVDNQGTFDESNPNIYYQLNNIQNNNILNLLNSNYDNSIYYDKEIELPESEKETVKQYKNIVNKIFDKTITAKEQAKGILIGNTPEKLVQAGLTKLPIRTKYDVIYDAHFGARKSDGTINLEGHQLPTNILRNIPELLQNPIIVMDSLTEENSVVVFVDAYDKDANNNDIPVMLAIKMDRNIGKRNSTYLVNSIRSIYSRSNYENLIERTILDKDKNIRKVDKNKIQDLLNKAPMVQSHRRGVNPANNIIPQNLKNKTFFQSAQNFDINSGIENNFGDSVENITEGIRADIQNILDENNISADEFKINDIRIYGSYATGQNKNTSDIDFLVEYSGTMREDDAFNIFSDAELKLTDINGKEVNVDINPIRKDKSGTIDEFLERNKDYRKNYIRTFFQSAYHGTPHRFDKFSLENIGTGEGAQAHGWGLYFAGDKDVSEGYRERLTKALGGLHHDLFVVKDNDNKEYIVKKDGEYLRADIDDEGYTYAYLKLKQLGKEKALKYLKDNGYPDYITDEISEAKEDNIEIIDLAEVKGQLFEVDIPDDDVLLDEDKKFSEQPKKVKEALIKLFNEGGEKYQKSLQDIIKHEYTGKYIYETIRENEGLEYYTDNNKFRYNSEFYKMASEKLNKYGIKGITYDGKQDGRCYVVFDDKAINVLKTYYQESDNEKRIAGYFYSEVMDKLQSIYSEMGNLTDNDKARSDELMAKAHILEDAIYISEGIEDYGESQNSEIMLNAYYVMSDEKLPDALIEEDSVSTRTYNDLKALHDEKKAKAEDEYRGYFTESNDKNVITIMSNSDASTALHELGHLFLNGLNELAKVNEDAKAQLDAFNKWLGYSGGEYTIAQQEKFARSFEAYLYNGKAPNSKLRTVFENFKEWLKSVYDYIVNIPEADISDEVQELFDNMFGDDSYYQEKKEAKQILSKVRKIKFKESKEVVNRDNKELDDYAKRHKDVCYSILSTATGKDIKYLKSIFETNSQSVATAKKRENIENLVSEVSDEITKAGGMQPEWREFYVDTGVDYDSDEIKGDYELAEKALRTIINKSYGMIDINSELEERAIYEYGRVNEAQLQYDYLVKEYKKGNRNVVLSAMYEWLDGLSSLREDFENKLIFDLNQIERQDKLNQFEKAKRQIISKALEFENRYGINSNQGYQELVKEVMKNLNFLQPADKAKMTVNILDINSTDMLMAMLNSIMDIAKTMEDVAFRRKLESEIHKELQTTKNIKKNGRTVGKYDYKSNKIFEELRELDKLKPEEANDLRLEMSKFATAEDNGLSYQDKIINKFLSYKANGRTYADTDLMKELYDEIIKIKMIGKSAKSEIDLQDKLSEAKDIDELIEIVQNKKEAGVIKKNYISWLGNLESTINAIFNNKIKEKYASEVLYAETQAQAWQHEIKTKFEKEVAKIYNLPEWMWDKKIIDYLAEKHTYSEIRRKYDEKGELVKQRNIDRTLTKMDIIQAYIWSKNEVLEKRLINQFGEDTLYSMFDELSLQDVRFAELLMETAQSFYPMVNRAFIRKYGLDLPKVSCYFPSTPERGSEVDLFNEYSSKSLNNSFTKARAQSETVAMDFHNPVATLYSHIDGVAKFSFMSEALDKINLRFKDNDLKRVIVNKFGEDVYRTLEQCLINVTYKKEATVFNGVNKILDNMIGNWIQANIAIKPMVGLKQLLSANNYAVDMPYMTWQKGFLKALAHPKETIDYMMSIPYLKARYEGNFSNEFLKAQIENSAFSTSKKLKDLCTVFVKMGDIGAIIFGGKPYIDYLVKEKGLEEDEAIKQFILSTNRSQQSSAVSSLSNFQVNMTRNPAGKLFIAFKNSPQQYIRMCGDAIISATNGDISKKQAVKLLFQYGYLQPLLYAVATSGSLLRWLFAGDDDDFLKDLSVSIFNLGSDSLPIIGDIYKYAINKMLYKEKNLPATTPLLGDMEKEINRISKEDVSVKDYFEAIGYLGLHVGLGYNSKAIGNMASGVGDIFTGEPVRGTMKILGYTKKRAEHISGND